MGVPCADDVMLNYQSTSYHDAAGGAAAPGPAARAGVRGVARIRPGYLSRKRAAYSTRRGNDLLGRLGEIL